MAGVFDSGLRVSQRPPVYRFSTLEIIFCVFLAENKFREGTYPVFRGSAALVFCRTETIKGFQLFDLKSLC